VARYYAMVTFESLGQLAPWREAAAEALDTFRAVRAASVDDPMAVHDLALALATAAGGALAFEQLEPADVALALARARERVAIPGRESVDAYVVLADVARRANAPGEAEDALRKALTLVATAPDGAAKERQQSEIAAKLAELRAERDR
jgi:hypothetical protein